MKVAIKPFQYSNTFDATGGNVLAQDTNVSESTAARRTTLSFYVGAGKKYLINDVGDITSSIVEVREMTI